MQLNRCPICHTRISLDALAQDEAGRELLGMLAKLDTDTGTALVGYLGLFRSKTRDLANDRALRMAKEVLALSESLPALAEAMRITVEQIRAKGGDPLSNHNYLRKVLGDCHGFKTDIATVGRDKPVGVPGGESQLPETLPLIPAYKGGKSKTAQALQALEEFGNG
jgi:hypothetical protein